MSGITRLNMITCQTQQCKTFNVFNVLVDFIMASASNKSAVSQLHSFQHFKIHSANFSTFSQKKYKPSKKKDKNFKGVAQQTHSITAGRREGLCWTPCACVFLTGVKILRQVTSQIYSYSFSQFTLFQRSYTENHDVLVYSIFMHLADYSWAMIYFTFCDVTSNQARFAKY